MDKSPPDIAPPSTDPDDIIQTFALRETEAEKPFNIPANQEKTRQLVTLIVVWCFALIMGFFSLTAILVTLFFDITRLERLGQMIQIIAGVVSPVVTFIFGYYFATKEKS